MTEAYSIVAEAPSVADYLRLRAAGQLSPLPAEAARVGLANSWFAVTLVHAGHRVGMGRVVGDGGCFLQIVDIVVAPEHRGRGLGRRIVAALVEHIDAHAPRAAFVNLFADVPADRLYARFGFTPTAPRSIGMVRRVP